MPTRMLVSPLSAAAENEQAHPRAAEDEEGWIDPRAEEEGEHHHGDDHPDPVEYCALGQADRSRHEQSDGHRSEAALYRGAPAPAFEPEPEPARPQREISRGAEERDDDEEGARHARHPLAHRGHHHHVGPGGDLPKAVEVNELRERQPVKPLHGEALHLWKRGQSSTHREERQIGEDADEGGELAHRPGTTGASVRGRYHQMASAPSPASTAMFVEFSPGRLWLMASIWTNVGSSIQPCLSTRLLRR